MAFAGGRYGVLVGCTASIAVLDGPFSFFFLIVARRGRIGTRGGEGGGEAGWGWEFFLGTIKVWLYDLAGPE